MKRASLLILILLALLLAACGPRPAATVVPTSTRIRPTTVPTAPIPTSAPAFCIAQSGVFPTPDPTMQAAFPPPSEKDWSLGPQDARLTIIEYSDFQCPYCAMLEPILIQLQETYPQDVQVVFRHFPLKSIHPNARLAAIAAEAAGKQDQFYVMTKILFEEQQTWGGMPDADFRTWLGNTARDLGLDADAFAADLDSPELGKKIDEAYETAGKAGINGTPFVVINGAPFQGERNLATFEAVLKLYQLADRQFTQCPPMNLNPAKKYTATLETSRGDIVLELYPDKAPVAVNSFIFLAQQGWYDSTTFYVVLPGSYVLAGDPTSTDLGHPGYFFDNEITELRFNRAGVVGMNNSGPNSNGSRFFITLSAQPKLDGSYTIFGQVLEGLDILTQLPAHTPDQGDASASAVKIMRVTVQED